MTNLKTIVVGLFAAGLLALVVMIAPSIARSISGTDGIYRQEKALELDNQRFNNQLAQTKAEASAPAVVLSNYLMLAAAAAFLTIGGMVGYKRLYKQPLVRFDAQGRLPVSRDLLAEVKATNDQVLAIIMQSIEKSAAIQIESARAMHRIADRVDYKITVSDRSPMQSQPMLSAPEMTITELPRPTVPTFATLLQYGRVGGENALLLGFTESGEELRGSWKDLYSTALGGLPGTGKTTSQRFFAAQTALMGAKFCVIDPHADAGEDSLTEALLPLSSRFICEPASETKSILDAVHLVADIGKRRISGDKDRTPIILFVDECTSLLSRTDISKELAELLERIAQEYRKVGVYASLSGQVWTASRAGGTELRDSLASVICHRMKSTQARRLLSTEDARLCERLDTGKAVLWRTNGISEVITIPNTTSADLITLEGQWKHCGSTVEAPTDAPNTLLASLILQSPDQARIIADFRAGRDISEIAKELAGVSSGRKYSDSLANVNGVVRTMITQVAV